MRVIFTAIIVAFMVVYVSLMFPTPDKTATVQINYSDLGKYQQRQIDCLAQNIYHEARSESNQGQQAVAFVTLNRTQDGRFPTDICGVVKQKSRTVCQFSWFCTKVKLDKTSDAYKEALQVALHVYANYFNLTDITGGALYYHADYVKPRWKLEKTKTIGRHIFYKEKEVIKL